MNTDEEIAGLVEAARSGDASARDALIMKHVQLVWSLGDEEARSAGLVKLVTGVDAYLADRSIAVTLSAYLSGVVRNAGTDALRDELRHRARIKRIRPGGSKMKMNMQELRKGRRSTSARPHTIVRRGSSPAAPLAAKELLDRACHTDLEKKVIKLKLKDYSNTEVAEILKMNKVAVGRVIAAIKERLTDA